MIGMEEKNNNKLITSHVSVSEIIFYSTILIVSITGILTPNTYNFLPVNLILDIAFCALILLNISNFSIKSSLIFTLLFSYFSISLLIAYSKNVHILDFIMAYKAFFYFSFLPLISNKNVFSIQRLQSFFNVLLVFFLIKYIYSVALGLSYRPGLYVENNFEMIFLLLFFFVAKSNSTNVHFFQLFIVSTIIVLSGSRSAMACLLIFFYFEFVRQHKSGLVIFSPILAILGALVIWFITLKIGGRDLEQIDRIRFLLLFIEETKDWNIYNWLLGTPVLTPLTITCKTLTYHHSLFSFSGNDECFSVLFHSFILRCIFDHGLLGLLSLSMTLIYILKTKGYLFINALGILLVLYASALSVSSFNSIYVAMGILLILLAKPKQNYLSNI
jgi:hypothetical protein